MHLVVNNDHTLSVDTYCFREVASATLLAKSQVGTYLLLFLAHGDGHATEGIGSHRPSLGRAEAVSGHGVSDLEPTRRAAGHRDGNQLI